MGLEIKCLYRKGCNSALCVRGGDTDGPDSMSLNEAAEVCLVCGLEVDHKQL